jgi:hypothetical protein
MVSGITPCAQECKWTDYFGEPPILNRQENTFFCLHDFLGSRRDVSFQLAGWNPAGSVKWKPAR